MTEQETKWLKENYPEGTEVYIDCCGECETWTFGENRCDCGNVRIDYWVEVASNGEFYLFTTSC